MIWILGAIGLVLLGVVMWESWVGPRRLDAARRDLAGPASRERIGL